MVFHSHEVVQADAQERRSRLLAEAAAHRLARLAQSANHAESPRRPARLQERLSAAAGALLVQWGERLQAGGRRQAEA